MTGKHWWKRIQMLDEALCVCVTFFWLLTPYFIDLGRLIFDPSFLTCRSHTVHNTEVSASFLPIEEPPYSALSTRTLLSIHSYHIVSLFEQLGTQMTLQESRLTQWSMVTWPWQMDTTTQRRTWRMVRTMGTYSNKLEFLFSACFEACAVKEIDPWSRFTFILWMTQFNGLWSC